MFLIPTQKEDGKNALFIVLEDSNIERIREYDPIMIDMKKMPAQYVALIFESIFVVYANKEQAARLTETKNNKDLNDMLVELGRGFKFKPELGDNDGAYEGKKEET